jgi:C4-dicarboxylate transporter DctM subunit
MLIGGMGIVVLLLLIFSGLPIAIALFLVGISGLFCVIGPHQALAAIAPTLYNYIANYTFSVIPMFVLMGNIGANSELFYDVFEVCRKLTGRVPAGLAVTAELAQTIFAACSGSGPASCVVIGRIAIPQMQKAGYPDELSTGVIAGAGALAVLIPPSVAMCVYGLIVDESIGKLLIAGFLPGLLTSALYIVTILIFYGKVPRDTRRYTWKEKFFALRYLWVVVGTITAIMGGLYAGVCTPTEGGAFGTFAVFMMALFSRRLNWGIIWKSIRETIHTTGMLLILLVSSEIFTRFLTISGFSYGVTEGVSHLGLPRFFIFLFVSAVYIFLGCFVSSLGMMVMTLPVFYPLMMSLGYDSIWFGIVVIMFVEVAMETPPFGINLFATKSVAPDVPLSVIIRGAILFVYPDLVAIGIIYVFPQIVSFLPNLM